ncbi:unnamed protein product [Periconia digitata]|uniref:Uncharacterized protein n=1 Tax=Periconia digitata TaxID=1303443 RepID=A0A9W4UFS7_9PLEO|nr:unnamed protein product [Periconia digitata]
MVKIIIHIPSLRKTLRRLSCGLLCNRAEESTQSIPNQSVSINQHHAGDENDWDLQPEHDVTSGIQNEDSPKTPNISESDKPVSRPSRYRNKRPSPLINDVPGMPLPNASNQEPFVPKEEAAEAAETASNITVEITPIEQEDVTTRPSSWTQEMTEFGRSIFNTSPLQLSPPHTYLNSTASQRHREIDSETLYSLAEETEADVIPSFHPYSIITPPPHISRSKTKSHRARDTAGAKPQLVYRLSTYPPHRQLHPMLRRPLRHRQN